MTESKHLDPEAEAPFFAGVRHAEEFFRGESRIHRALDKVTRLLDDAGIPYAIVGALALGEFGCRRSTEDINVLLTAGGLQAFKSAHLGRGYVEKFPGSKGLRDAENNVPIDVIIAGEYPGDGQPKPIAFPDPAVTAERGARVCLLPIERLIELKLASGMSAPHRLRDLADVIELIRVQDLPEDFSNRVDPTVRDKFVELWSAALVDDGE